MAEDGEGSIGGERVAEKEKVAEEWGGQQRRGESGGGEDEWKGEEDVC